MQIQYGWWLVVLLGVTCGITGCGGSKPEPTTGTGTQGGAGQGKSGQGDQGAPGDQGSSRQPGGGAGETGAGVTSGGGRFVPPGGGRPADPGPPDTNEPPLDKPATPREQDDGAGPGTKSSDNANPLRQPGAETEDEPVAAAAPAKPGADPPLARPESSTAPNVVSAVKPAAATNAAKAGQSRVALFQGWTKPDAVLVVTGRQNGYIEPCGCAGLVNQKGGMARRMTLMRELNQRGWPVAAVDVGNLVKRYGRQSEIKFQIALEGLRQMDYRAIGLGPDDLRLSAGELFAAASEEPHRLVSANVTILDPAATPTHVVIERGGLKIGVTSVLGDEYVERVKSDEVATRPAEAGLKEAAAALAGQNCDWQVLLVYGSAEETRKLARRFPQFQIVVTAGGAEEPAFEPERLADAETLIVQTGAKGMYVGVVGLYRSGKIPLRYQRVPLDDRYADAPEMLRLLAAYQDQLREAGLDGLEVKAAPHPSGRTYVGSEKCGDCHTKALAKWQATGHAKATESLVHPGERSEIQRHFDPECLSCHVTGWEPQRMYPFRSGYLSLQSTPALVGSGCENCHGPGSAHVAAEEGTGNPAVALVKQLRGEMQLPLKAAQQKCVECHDQDNSPAFHHEGAFQEYWRRVAHPGKD